MSVGPPLPSLPNKRKKPEREPSQRRANPKSSSGLAVNVPRYRVVPTPDDEGPLAGQANPRASRRRRHKVDPGRLFAQLVIQRPTPRGGEFIFRGNPDALWRDLSLFVDQEAQNSPLYTFEQVERADGVLLRITGARPTEES